MGAHDRCQLPVSGDPLQRTRRIVRRLKNRRKIEVASNVNGRAVAAVESAVGGIGVDRSRKFRCHQIADAMRISVIRQHREVARKPVLSRDNQRVVAGRPAVIQIFDGSVIRPLRGIQLRKQSARLGIGGGGTWPRPWLAHIVQRHNCREHRPPDSVPDPSTGEWCYSPGSWPSTASSIPTVSEARSSTAPRKCSAHAEEPIRNSRRSGTRCSC